jgi:hypothetical protein
VAGSRGIALLALVALWRERQANGTGRLASRWVWGLGAAVALVLSVAEMTRFPLRLGLLGFPTPDIYQSFVAFSLWLALLLLLGSFLLGRLSSSAGPGRRHAILGISLWGFHFLSTVLTRADLVPESWLLGVAGIRGLALLTGSTLLLMAVGEYAPGGHSKRNACYGRFPNIMGGTYTGGGSVSTVNGLKASLSSEKE